MADSTTPATITQTIRAGQSLAPRGAERTHTLVAFVEDRPGAVDRVIGTLRRRRANMRSLTLASGERPDEVRITAQVTDSEVEIEQLVEQLRKIVDVQQVLNLKPEQAITRELALVKVSVSPENLPAILDLAHQFAAYPADITGSTLTLEVTCSEKRLQQLLTELQPYGIRDVARSGSVAIAR